MIDELRLIGEQVGLARVGIAPPTEEVLRYRDWARSVVVAAVSYLPPESEPVAGRGLVARFARGADYHAVLRGKLERLVEAIRSRYPGCCAEVCVDTCPLPERKLAVLAGIAWRGKNGNVFVEGCGSWCALGEILTDIELPASGPLDVDRCGECDRCIRACPTGAITAPFTVDPSRCLSQLTQMSGSIPREFRALLGGRIYGCDACQEACPQNDGVRPSAAEFAETLFPGAYPELPYLIGLSAREFRQRVKDSSVGWIGRSRIRRNAAIAAGNLRCEDAVPALVGMLSDENPVLRAHAAWALGRIGSHGCLRALAEARNRERDPDVIKEISIALSKMCE